MALQAKDGPGWGQPQWGSSHHWGGSPQWTHEAGSVTPIWTEYPEATTSAWPTEYPHGHPTTECEASETAASWPYSEHPTSWPTYSQPTYSPSIYISTTWSSTTSNSTTWSPTTSNSTTWSPTTSNSTTLSPTTQYVPPSTTSTPCGPEGITFYGASWYGYRPVPGAPPLATYYITTDTVKSLAATSIYCNTTVFNKYLRSMDCDLANGCAGAYQTLNSLCEIVVGPVFTTAPCQSDGYSLSCGTQTGPSGNVVSLGISAAATCLTTTNNAGQTGVVSYASKMFASPITYTGDVIAAAPSSIMPRLVRRDQVKAIAMPNLHASTSIAPWNKPRATLQNNAAVGGAHHGGGITTTITTTGPVSKAATVFADHAPSSSSAPAPSRSPTSPTRSLKTPSAKPPVTPTSSSVSPNGPSSQVTPPSSPGGSSPSTSATGTGAGVSTSPSGNNGGTPSDTASSSVSPATGAAATPAGLSDLLFGVPGLIMAALL